MSDLCFLGGPKWPKIANMLADFGNPRKLSKQNPKQRTKNKHTHTTHADRLKTAFKTNKKPPRGQHVAFDEKEEVAQGVHEPLSQSLRGRWWRIRDPTPQLRRTPGVTPCGFPANLKTAQRRDPIKTKTSSLPQTKARKFFLAPPSPAPASPVECVA